VDGVNGRRCVRGYEWVVATNGAARVVNSGTLDGSDGQRGAGRGEHGQRGEPDSDQWLYVKRDVPGGGPDERAERSDQFCGEPAFSPKGGCN
jgi:hypothetical protein